MKISGTQEFEEKKMITLLTKKNQSNTFIL